MAVSLQGDTSRTGHASTSRAEQKVEGKDIWEDKEMLRKVAAIYMSEPADESGASVLLDFDCDADSESEKSKAESSAWGASRKTKDKPMLGNCVACGDEKDFFEVARVPCKNEHEYCRDCLAELFRLSMTDETLFPPRCCSEPIPLNRVRFFLPPELAKEFASKFDELNTKNRTYCHDRSCQTFVPVNAIENDIATCPNCERITCTMCKEPSHSGDCPEDTALQQLVDTADANQWQRGYQCNKFVELSHGCNHITYDLVHQPPSIYC